MGEEEKSVLVQLREAIKQTEESKQAIDKKISNETDWHDSDNFITNFTKLIGNLKSLTTLPEDTKFNSNVLDSSNIEVKLEDIEVPAEYLDIIDKPELNDPRLLLSFKKKTSLEEQERNKRYFKNFKSLTNELESFINEYNK